MAEEKAPPKKRGEHQNVARAAMVIDAISKAGPYGLRMTDVIEDTQLGVATVHRLLNGLVTYGFIDHDADKNRYFLGIQLVSWAAKATDRYGLLPFVDERLSNIAARTEDTVYFSLTSGDDAVCVDRREGAYPIRTLTLNIGDRRPLGVGAGSLALMAFQSAERISELLKHQEKTRLNYTIDNEYLISAIADTKRSGYAINQEKLISGMSAIAVPVCKKNGEAVGAISVAAISSRLNDERIKEIAALLRSEAEAIENEACDVLNTAYAKRYSVAK